MSAHCPITIPERVARLPRDHRGYPIPVVVQRDPHGLPLFIVNDSRVQIKCIHHKLCSICGEKLVKQLWFTGGPMSALHHHGCYLDSAMHHECAQYAMQVCPYLSRSEYKQPDLEVIMPKLEAKIAAGPDAVGLVDHTIDPDRPELFMLVMAYGQQLVDSGRRGAPYLKPLRPYHAVEYWQHGKRLDAAAGLELVKKLYGHEDLDLSALRLVTK